MPRKPTVIPFRRPASPVPAAPSPAPASPTSRRERNLGVAAAFWQAINLTPEDLPEFAAIIRGTVVIVGPAEDKAATVTQLRPVDGGAS